MSELRLNHSDAIELAELLTFLTDWLSGSQQQPLADSLAAYVGHDRYNIDELRNDLHRFVFLLGLNEHLTNAEIGARLFIQIRTVESHVSSLLRKLQAEDRRALAAVARNLRAIRRARRPRESRLLSRCRRRLRRSLGGWPSGRRCRLSCGAWSRPSDQAGSVRRARP